MAEGIAGSEESQCCMEFRGTELLNVMILCFGLFTEGSGLYCLRGQKSFTAQRQDRV